MTLGFLAVNPGGAGKMATDVITDVGPLAGVSVQLEKSIWGVEGQANLTNLDNPLPVQLSADVPLPVGENIIGHTFGGFVTSPVLLQRPATFPAGLNNTYIPGSAWANSTTAPTAGGFIFPGVSRLPGGSVIAKSIVITSSQAASNLSGVILPFSGTVTAVPDGSPMTFSFAEACTQLPSIPFDLSTALVLPFSTGLSIPLNDLGFTLGTGQTDLHFLLFINNAYAPLASEQLHFALSVVQAN